MAVIDDVQPALLNMLGQHITSEVHRYADGNSLSLWG